MAIRGGGTGLDGGAVATRGGLLLSLREMNRITEISPADMVAVVQPGVTTSQINAQLRPFGLFYPIDPASQSQSTIGGNVATAAHGLRCLKYGPIGSYMLGLEVVAPPGEIIRCGAKTLKYAAGYHLTDLLVGSRGQIGIITEIILKLLPRPQAQVSLMATFPKVGQANLAKETLRKRGIWPSRLELMDARATDKGLVDLHVELSRDQVLLLTELDGPESMVKGDVQATMKILAEEGAEQVRLAEDDREAGQWWEARGKLLSRLVGETSLAILLSIIVPGDKTVLFFEKVTRVFKGTSVSQAIYGHLGEGRWHIVFQTRNGEAAGKQALSRLAEAVQKIANGLGCMCLRAHTIGFVPEVPLSPPRDPGQKRLWNALRAKFDPHSIFDSLK